MRRVPKPPILQDAVHENPPRRATAVVSILLSLLLGGSLLGLLFYRAAMPKPDCIFIVRADRDWDGVELSMEGSNLHEPQITRLERAGNFVVPFFLWPGKYVLHVRGQGVEVYSQQIELARNEQLEIDLTRTGATTMPTTMHAMGSTSRSPASRP